MRVLVALLVLALGGCLGQEAPADAAGPASPGTALEATPAGDAAPAAASSIAPRGGVVYFTADLGVSGAVPADEERVPLGPTVNSPLASGYPQWGGVVPASIAGASGDATLVLYVTCTAACAAANTVAVVPADPLEFSDFIVEARVGNLSASAGVEGPDALVAGDVVEVRVPLGSIAAPLREGAHVELLVVATYTHVEEASEVLFVIGPEHAMRIEIGDNT